MSGERMNEFMGDDSDNNSEISDSSLPPLEFASDDEEDLDKLIADIPKYEIPQADSEMKENCQGITSTKTESSSSNALMVLPTPNDQKKTQGDTEVPWRSLASLQGESIDDALEQAKAILQNANIGESQTSSGHDQVFNKPRDPRRRPQQYTENQEVILIDDSFESTHSDHWRQVTNPSVRNEVIVLEDSTADSSDVLEVTVKAPELKPVEDDTVNDDEDFEITGEKQGDILPHHRADCPKNKFTKLRPYQQAIEANETFCEKCFCFICDKASKDCESWSATEAPHSNAWKSSEWKVEKQIWKKETEKPKYPEVARPPATGWGFEDYAWHNRTRVAARQQSPPRWGDSRSIFEAGRSNSWGWNETSATIEASNNPGTSTSRGWGGDNDASSVKRELESKGSSSNGNSPNPYSDNSDVEFVADRTNEELEFGQEDAPILNLMNISRFNSRIREQEREREKKEKEERKRLRKEREWRPPTQSQISFWEKQKEKLQKNPMPRPKKRYSSWDNDPSPSTSSSLGSDAPSTSGLNQRNNQNTPTVKYQTRTLNTNQQNRHSSTSFYSKNSSHNYSSSMPSRTQGFNRGRQQSRPSNSFSSFQDSRPRAPAPSSPVRNGPIYNDVQPNCPSTMPKRRKQHHNHQPPKQPAFQMGYNRGSRS